MVGTLAFKVTRGIFECIWGVGFEVTCQAEANYSCWPESEVRRRQSGELERVAHWHAADELVSMVPSGGLWRPESWLEGLWDNSSILIEKVFLLLFSPPHYCRFRFMCTVELCNQAYTCLFRLLRPRLLAFFGTSVPGTVYICSVSCVYLLAWERIRFWYPDGSPFATGSRNDSILHAWMIYRTVHTVAFELTYTTSHIWTHLDRSLAIQFNAESNNEPF